MTTDEARLYGHDIVTRVDTLERKYDWLSDAYKALVERVSDIECETEHPDETYDPNVQDPDRENDEEEEDDVDPEESPFRDKFDILKEGMSKELRQACVVIYASMEMAWALARQIFGEQARPRHAFEMYERIAVTQNAYLQSPADPSVDFIYDQLQEDHNERRDSE